MVLHLDFRNFQFGTVQSLEQMKHELSEESENECVGKELSVITVQFDKRIVNLRQ